MEQSRILDGYLQRTRSRILILFALALLLLLLTGVAATLGSYPISVLEVYATIFAGPGAGSEAGTIVWDYRLPRILMGILTGAALGLAGAVMQGILRNPLASPFTLGIASAASFGASLAIILGAGFVAGGYLIAANAFIFTLLAAALVYGLAQVRGITPETMIMAGIAIMYLFSALTSFLQYIGTSEDVHAVVFWMFGSLGRATWDTVTIAFLIFALTFPIFIFYARSINALAAGDETAASLGVAVERVRLIGMGGASLLTAGVICFTGTIGFIGLVAPHITRMIIGGDNRFLLPGTALMGAIILLAADSVGRMIMAPMILPVGIMTAFLGVPFFLYLFLRRRRDYW
ncbi:MAG: iron ABC transporter permease [Methanocalculus sp.]|uniref:FecCD family ABC transporter permease n=1 Tax=Methanocalculus sp. TaxID=2004547 RepID=UPI00272814B4|nr:iron ABC transporter permease [Methanocalculus sp.]MDO9538970.1 iron ABC transporter permease [Methanocalculus sp.]